MTKKHAVMVVAGVAGLNELFFLCGMEYVNIHPLFWLLAMFDVCGLMTKIEKKGLVTVVIDLITGVIKAVIVLFIVLLAAII